MGDSRHVLSKIENFLSFSKSLLCKQSLRHVFLYILNDEAKVLLLHPKWMWLTLGTVYLCLNVYSVAILKVDKDRKGWRIYDGSIKVNSMSHMIIIP